MFWGKWLVIAIAIAAALGLLGYEAYALVSRRGITISEFIWTATAKYPLIPLLFGFITGLLSGHFFWQRS
jgi:hypothetical protein